MAISPFEVNTGITRIQDFSILKQNEDNKNFVDQQGIHVRAEKEHDEKPKKVQKQENTESKKGQYDAREKSSNQYMGDGGKNRKKKNVDQDGTVIEKKQSKFDIKI